MKRITTEPINCMAASINAISYISAALEIFAMQKIQLFLQTTGRFIYNGGGLRF